MSESTAMIKQRKVIKIVLHHKVMIKKCYKIKTLTDVKNINSPDMQLYLLLALF